MKGLNKQALDYLKKIEEIIMRDDVIVTEIDFSNPLTGFNGFSISIKYQDECHANQQQ